MQLSSSNNTLEVIINIAKQSTIMKLQELLPFMQEAAGVEYEVPWTQNPNAESIAKKRVLPVPMHTLRLGSGRDKPGAVRDSGLRIKGLRSRGFGFGVSPLALEFAIPTHISS